VFQEGQMHFQFVTSYRRDHAHLEDFQPHRRIFGVKYIAQNNMEMVLYSTHCFFFVFVFLSKCDILGYWYYGLSGMEGQGS
jgi:hypothetical protein